MGNGTTKYTCALGGFSPTGDAVYIEEAGPEADQVFYGRRVHTTFRVTDQLINFFNGDLLRRTKMEVKFNHVRREDDHTLLFLMQVSKVRDADEDAKLSEKLDEAWGPTIGTFKCNIGELERDNEDVFYQIKHGTMPMPLQRDYTVPVPSLTDEALARYSNIHFQGSNLDQ